jgi:hypothetical protein
MVRVTVNDAGEAKIDEGNAPFRDTPERIPAQIRHGGLRTRVSFDTETGETRLETSQPGQARVVPSPQGPQARDNYGPKLLSKATPKDVITLPGMGDARAEVWEQMGHLVALPNGGYALTQQTATPQQPQQQEQPKQSEVPAADPADLRGVEGTSPTSDAVLKSLQTHAPMQLERIIDSMAKGTPVDYEEAARMLGDEKAPEKLQTLHAETLRAGQTVLRNVGVEPGSLEAFETWARSNHPEEASDAIRDMVESKAVGRLASLGRRFVEVSNQRLATLIQSKGVDTRVENGQVFVSGAQLGIPRQGDFGAWVPLRKAIADGYIRI